jgi:tRNA modification GTPase
LKNTDFIFKSSEISKKGFGFLMGHSRVNQLTPKRLTDLENKISNRLTGIHVTGTELMIDSLRQMELLQRSKESLEVVTVSLIDNVSLDAVAMDLKDSLDALGEITGEVSSVDILNNIFSGFCVGK